jgi:hypothetical protein
MNANQLRIQLSQSNYTILRVSKKYSYYVIERFSTHFNFIPWSMSDYNTRAEATKAINALIKISPNKYINDAFINDPETLKLLKPDNFYTIKSTVISTHPLV